MASFLAEISSVATVLRSGCVNYWTGPYVQDFEQKFSDWTGIAYSVGHANGTLALENAYRALSLHQSNNYNSEHLSQLVLLW